MRSPHETASSLIRNKFLVAITLSVLILSIVFLLSSERFPFSNTQNFTGVLMKTANLGIRDILLSRFSTNPLANKNIVIVAIDNRSLSDETGLWRFQDYQRSYYATVIDHLKRDGAAVIGVDVLFSEKSSDDTILERSMRSAGNVVLGFSLTENLFPVEILERAAFGLGYFHPKINARNSSVYGIIPSKIRGDETWEAFSFTVLRRYFDTLYGTNDTNKVGTIIENGGTASYLLRTARIPYASDNSDEVLISYVPRSSKFATVSFSDVYSDVYDRSLVRDKIVLIGSTAAALFDRFNTPLGIQDGVYIHANMINTILNQSYLTEVDEMREIALLILLTFFLVFFTLHVDNRIYQLAFAAIGLVIFLFGEYVYFHLFHRLFQYPTELLLIIFFVATSVTGYKYLYEEKGKRLLRNTLSQYLAEDLVLNVLENYEEVRLGGVRREITTFFSDIAGFTTLSENMEPEEIVRFLSTYLRETSDIIMHEHGFINKYEWDAIMAIWWAFGAEPRQSELACYAALAQQQKIRELNAYFQKEYGFSIRVRMGINKGPAVVGNIGSQGKKIEYTALGDSVNTASRFEGINKLYGTSICVGESIAEATREQFIFRKLDHIQVKGKGNSLYIYELIGTRESADESVLNLVARYEEALGLYFAQRFPEALDILSGLTERDAPSRTLFDRITILADRPQNPDWTGVFQAQEK